MNFKDWGIDYVELASVFRESRTFVADVPRMREIFLALSRPLGFTAEEIEQLCALEVGFPTDYSTYRSSMRGGANGHYTGPTQAGAKFWIDVQSFKPSLKLPVERTAASLEQLISAPFIYADRYRAAMESFNFPAKIEFVYALHQQGSGAAKAGFPQIAGVQSKRSVPVVQAVQHFVRTGNYRKIEI